MIDSTTPTSAAAFNAFRLIDDGERLGIHRVAIDDAGAVVAWEPEPARLEVPSRAGDAINARWRITGQAFGAANCTYGVMPVLLLRDGKLIELPEHGGEDAEHARPAKVAIAA